MLLTREGASSTWVPSLLAGLFLAGAAVHALASPPPQSWTPGTPHTGAPGVTEGVGQIMARDRRNGTTPQPKIHDVKPKKLNNLTNVPANPDSPLTSQWPLPDV